MRMGEASQRPVALTIGAFDGVHLGHQELIRLLVDRAHADGLTPVCVTFDPDPEVVLHPERVNRGLSSTEERLALIRGLGAEAAAVGFTLDVAAMTAESFISGLFERYALRLLVVGPDFALGRDRAGSIDSLRRIGAGRGFEVAVVEPMRVGGRVVHSSWVREALAEGAVDLAAELLGRPYGWRGRVVNGMHRGRELGFPTANLIPPLGRARPLDGVYHVGARLVRTDGSAGEHWEGVANLGSRPTFAETAPLLEVHLLDFTGDIYGQDLAVQFVSLVRGIRRFSGLDELRAQIGLDIATVRERAARRPDGADPI